jgi:hypothetical protein
LSKCRSQEAVREVTTCQIARSDNPEQIQQQFLLQQWREIEEMLVEKGGHETDITAQWREIKEMPLGRGAHDTGITALE